MLYYTIRYDTIRYYTNYIILYDIISYYIISYYIILYHIISSCSSPPRRRARRPFKVLLCLLCTSWFMYKPIITIIIIVISLSLYICNSIYIYIHREREREMYTYIYIYMYLFIYCYAGDAWGIHGRPGCAYEGTPKTLSPPLTSGFVSLREKKRLKRHTPIC